MIFFYYFFLMLYLLHTPENLMHGRPLVTEVTTPAAGGSAEGPASPSSCFGWSCFSGVETAPAPCAEDGASVSEAALHPAVARGESGERWSREPEPLLCERFRGKCPWSHEQHHRLLIKYQTNS